MHRFKNLAITGAKGVGKTTLARWLLQQLQLPYRGFRTVRYGMTELGPLYEMVDISSGEASPISSLAEEGIRGIPESFETFGVRVIRDALESPVQTVMLDEIGRFERNSPAFLAGIQELLDSEKTVIAVLKQEPLAHIQKIKAREDTLLIDLDRCSREQAREIALDWMEKSGIRS